MSAVDYSGIVQEAHNRTLASVFLMGFEVCGADEAGARPYSSEVNCPDGTKHLVEWHIRECHSAMPSNSGMKQRPFAFPENGSDEDRRYRARKLREATALRAAGVIA